MAANYDKTSWFYDALSRLVFGRNIIKAQVALLPYITPNASLLIVGGGTGWILEKIAQIHSGLQITYVEVSVNMMALSRKRDCGSNHVTFINEAIESVTTLNDFDVVLTPYFFSNFKDVEAMSNFAHINGILKHQGTWLNIDFQKVGKRWHSAMLQTMYLFFNLFGAVNNNKLTDMTPVLTESGYKLISAQTFYGNFIAARAWKR